jgi:hypothetical protein
VAKPASKGACDRPHGGSQWEHTAGAGGTRQTTGIVVLRTWLDKQSRRQIGEEGSDGSGRKRELPLMVGPNDDAGRGG